MKKANLMLHRPNNKAECRTSAQEPVIDSVTDIDLAIVKVKAFLQTLQQDICTFLEKEDGQANFILDPWKYKDSGGGVSCVMSGGAHIEKAGVNFSHVSGGELPKAATMSRPELAKQSFQALGVSVVVHPLNPYAPTTHMNVRFIAVENPECKVHWWFGGGFDLTPYYGFEEDCEHWHREAKKACDPFKQDLYAKYKKWCDEYFFLKHRDEARGIGGLFFDDLNEFGFETCFAFMQSVGKHFISAYQPILSRRKNHAYGERERDFQLYRRGRYVEFNLLHDRGTLFGLQSGGRTESILMSLPPHVTWRYNWHPKEGSREEKLYTDFLIPKNWI